MINNTPIQIFDRQKIRHQRRRAMSRLNTTSGGHGFLLDWTRDQLLSRLDPIKKEFPDVLQVGLRTILDKKLIPSCTHLTGLDGVTPSSPITISGFDHIIIADEEYLPIADGTFDLIISPLALHTTNDLPGTLIQLCRALKPDGLLMAAMLGGETLRELRDAFASAEIDISGGISPRVAPFADMPQMGALIQRAGYALPVIDSEIISVSYDHPFKLMHDLRYMGEGNALIERAKSFNNKKLLARVAQIYRERYSEPDGRVTATFEIIFLTGWRPHDSQQKPLKPGSAKTRLADVLLTDEIILTE